MVNNIIAVKTRKEFIDLFRKLFIPSCIKMGSPGDFDIAYGINNWTTFWIYNEDDTFTIVELETQA